MQRPLMAAMCLVLTLGACSAVSNSRFNPFNWFGSSTEELPPLAARAEDPRLLVEQVTDLTLDKLPGGVIVRATGLPPTQGFWEAELVARDVDENGVLVYEFRVFPPVSAKRVSTVPSREITAGAFISDFKLREIGQITVQGKTNARTSRR